MSQCYLSLPFLYKHYIFTQVNGNDDNNVVASNAPWHTHTHIHNPTHIRIVFMVCGGCKQKKQKQHDIIGFVNGTNALLGMALRMRINQVVEMMRVRILGFGIRCHFKYVYILSENVYGVCTCANDGPFPFNVIYCINFE